MDEPRFDECLCAVCRRPAIGLAWAPKRIKSITQIAWVCDDPECIAIAKDSYEMRQLEFNRVDAMATVDAGAALEAYCEKIGKSDLRELTADEWDHALKTTIGSYRAALKGRLKNEAPF